MGTLRNAAFVVLALLLILLGLPATAQLKFGELSSDMTGTLSTGYTGTYGNLIDSDHSLTFGGTGTLSGFYYNPNFVSFAVSPYLNQARDNSSYQSISNASGVNFTSQIFSGSHFPGAISYAKAYNSEGTFAVPGVANYTSHGDSQTFAVNWAETLPGLPTLSANFQMGNNQYSIYGSNDNGESSNRSFALRSSYRLKGFSLGAYFSDGESHSEIPEVLQGSTQTESSNGGGHGFGFGVGHALPFHGGFSANFNRSDVDTSFAGFSYSGTVDTYDASASFQPTQKSHFSIATDYSDNLTASLYQAVAGAGGVATPTSLGAESRSFDLIANATYAIRNSLGSEVSADHREQFYLGKDYSADSFGAGLTYTRTLLGGNLNAAGSITDSITSTSIGNTMGFTGTVNYNKRFDGWTAGSYFSYAQNVQTLLITYMSSSYGYGGNLRRRWGRFGWSAGANASRTGLTEQAGTTSSSENFNSSIGYGQWANLIASYSKSNGNAIQTGAGLAVMPTPQPVLDPNDLILFRGESYSFGLASNPMRRLTVAATFSRALGSSDVVGVSSSNNTEQFSTLLNYQFRKMYLVGGYSRLVQGFSASSTPQENVSSFYIGITRWFNFF